MRRRKSEIDASELRRHAEQMAQWLVVHPFEGEVSGPRLLHELQVHQVELEMQKAELLHAAAEADEALRQANLLNERMKRSAGTGTASTEAAVAATRAKLDSLVKMSDDMKAPLRVIAEMSRQIRRSGVNIEQAERLDKIDIASEQLSKAVKAATKLYKRKDA